MKTVIFDLDDTLLCGDSEFKWAEFTVEKSISMKFDRITPLDDTNEKDNAETEWF